MCNMPAEGIKIEKHFCKNLGQYFTDGFGSDGSVVKGLKSFSELSYTKDISYLNQYMYITVLKPMHHGKQLSCVVCG